MTQKGHQCQSDLEEKSDDDDEEEEEEDEDDPDEHEDAADASLTQSSSSGIILSQHHATCNTGTHTWVIPTALERDEREGGGGTRGGGVLCATFLFWGVFTPGECHAPKKATITCL